MDFLRSLGIWADMEEKMEGQENLHISILQYAFIISIDY